jgi:hypothetical protein
VRLTRSDPQQSAPYDGERVFFYDKSNDALPGITLGWVGQVLKVPLEGRQHLLGFIVLVRATRVPNTTVINANASNRAGEFELPNLCFASTVTIHHVRLDD